MTVDVIIPAYNDRGCINRAIASVAMQNTEAFLRVTIVNDCGEGYEDIVDYWKEMINIQEVNRDINGGAGQARQTGIDNTNGEFFMFVDADDTLIGQDAIERLRLGVVGFEMCMGNFLEEKEDKTTIKHDINQIWMHGKIYRRSFIEKIGLRFNDTRYNEDVGYNSVISRMTDKIAYIDKDVYFWTFRKNSTVRRNKDEYRYGYGWRNLVENEIWAYEELKKRGVDKDVLESLVAQCFTKQYFQFIEGAVKCPNDLDDNREELRKFYREVYSKENIDRKTLVNEFVRQQDVYQLRVIPAITFDEFVEMLK